MEKNHMDKLLEILQRLDTPPDGCAWTQGQTHASLTPYLIEEAHEAADAIDRGKTDDELRDELGDLLLQIALHAQIASRRGAFSFDDVARVIVEKLTRRYPTILGDEPNTLKTAEDIDRRWEEIKAAERAAKGGWVSIFDGIAHGLPSLMRAAKIKSRAAREGWEWPDVSMLLEKIGEEVAELRAEVEAPDADTTKIAAELGDVLFLLVDFARLHGIDAEDALRTTNNRIERRLRHLEDGLKQRGKTIATSTPDERRALWDEAKRVKG